MTCLTQIHLCYSLLHISSLIYPMKSSTEYKPIDKDQPLDTVSVIIWDPYQQQPTFITASWDGYVRVYSITQTSTTCNINKIWQFFLQHPVLCIDITQKGILFVGLASGHIAAIEINSNTFLSIGTHDAPINGIFWMREFQMLMSLGYDNSIKFWNFENSASLVHEVKLPLKTITSCYDYPYLLIGSIETTVVIVNMKNISNANFPQSASNYCRINLEKFSKFNCSRILASQKRAIIGSIDGRCTYFYFKQSYSGSFQIPIVQKQNPIVSRGQKKIEGGKVMFGQVNAVDIGYIDHSFFSMVGGSEDLAGFNLSNKSKVGSYINQNSTTGAITAVRLRPKLDYMAVGTGSDWLKGLHELETIKRPKIVIIKLATQDLKKLICK